MPADEDLPPFQPLRARRAGLPLDTSLREEPPPALVPFLAKWIEQACQIDPVVGQRAALRLDLVRPGYMPDYGPLLSRVPPEQLLEAIDVILRFHRALGELDPFDDPTQPAQDYENLIYELRHALLDARMALTIAESQRQLIDRIDPAVAEAFDRAVDSATPTAGDLLRDALNEAYGLHPDPTTAYRQAVRAVEEVAGPLVLPNNPKPSLGTVHDHLRNAGHKWCFELVDKDGDHAVNPIVAMMERLWTGQVSRHGGGQNNRDQTQAEAEAAVHLAATLVQLLSSGALTRRDTP